MKVINCTQGSPEWHAHRLNHFNASDAPAMMGCSPYKTRAELVREVATGLTAEVDAATQKLFDDGHRTEALARPIAEKIIGAELYPVVGANGVLSASFDGLTIDDRISFECKRLNKRLREAMFPGCTGADLPLDYQVQMEQQHAVNEAGERTLFVAAHFDDAGQLIEERHCWYTPNLELRGRILAGWKQFEADVAAYQPGEAAAPVVVAQAVQALPAVSVTVSGEIAIRDNFKAFEVALRDFLEHRLIREPKTDQDFADLDVQIKAMKGAEAALESAEGQMLAQIASVDTAKKTKDMLHKLVRDNRLMAEKLLASEKERRKAEIVTAGQAAARSHCNALTARVGVQVQVAGDFAGVIKGKKSLSSMEDAIATELARVKIEASRIADLIDENNGQMVQAEAGHLFPDFAQVCTKPADDFANLITSRKAAAAAQLERERERIRAEEAARLEREAQAKVAEEARQKQEAEALAARQREEAEALERRQREANVAAQHSEAQDSQQVLKAEPATADATDRDAPAITSPSVGSMGAGQPADAGPVAGRAAPAPEVRAFPAPAVAANEVDAITLKLGELWDVLGLTDREAFLAGLGFPATPAPKGTGKLYLASKLPDICMAISQHFAELAGQKKAA